MNGNRGVRRRVILMAASAIPGVFVFAIIAANQPAPRWIAALASFGIASTCCALVFLVVDAVRARTRRPSYFFPDRRRTDNDIYKPLDRIVPRWLWGLTTIVALLAETVYIEPHSQPWWIDISALAGFVVGISIVESTIWLVYLRLRG